MHIIVIFNSSFYFKVKHTTHSITRHTKTNTQATPPPPPPTPTHNKKTKTTQKWKTYRLPPKQNLQTQIKVRSWYIFSNITQLTTSNSDEKKKLVDRIQLRRKHRKSMWKREKNTKPHQHSWQKKTKFMQYVYQWGQNCLAILRQIQCS